MENKYYNAKQLKGENAEEAIEEFLGVPALEQEKGDWGFKGLKQAIKLEFKLGRYDKVGGSGPKRSAQTTNGSLCRLSSTTRNFSRTSKVP